MSRPPSVIIVGGGFGGLCAAQALKSAPVDVTLIDRNNYHLFPAHRCQLPRCLRYRRSRFRSASEWDAIAHSGFCALGNPRSDLQSRGTAHFRDRSYRLQLQQSAGIGCDKTGRHRQYRGQHVTDQQASASRIWRDPKLKRSRPNANAGREKLKNSGRTPDGHIRPLVSGYSGGCQD